MDAYQENCEKEPIHLIGRIQSFGYLIVFDEEDRCMAISENCSELITGSVNDCLQQDMTMVLGLIQPNCILEHSPFHDVRYNSPSHRTVQNAQIKGKSYYFSVYTYQKNTFWEFEQMNSARVPLTNLHNYASRLNDSSTRLWKNLTENISSITGYDRVMIYRFHEDNSGQVIAETINNNLEPLLGYRYPEFDIPKQARELYKHFLSRHTPNIDALTYALIGNTSMPIDLSHTSVRALSPIHLQYLSNANVKASASFSIIVNDQLWGLVACQNQEPKHVDLSQRHLCVFLTQYAVNRYISNQRDADLVYAQNIKSLELELKEKLLVNKDVLTVLKEMAIPLMEMVSADGLVLQSSEGTWHYGETPSKEQFKHIHQFIKQHAPRRIEAYNTFSLPDEYPQDNMLFPGIAKIDIDSTDKLNIYWFRAEIIIEETWAGKPEKIIQYDPVQHISYPSPRTSFQAWKHTVKGQSKKWLKKELLFMRRVRQMVQESILKKAAEIQRLNERLIELNNVLDTYSYTLTHDLKNPLSSIRLSAQLIHSRDNLSRDFLQKLSSNILDAVDLMSSMMEKVFAYSKTSSFEFEYECIDPKSFIIDIIEESRSQLKLNNLKFVLGEIHPIYAERTLLYQLFSNLLTNAVKYSSKKIQPTVQIDSYQTDQETRYIIQDNGIGMAVEHQDKIFEIFKRLPNAAGYEGSGVGLSIVKRIVDRLHARIEVESTVDQGTKFTLAFNNQNSPI